jgi:hypothetical protein
MEKLNAKDTKYDALIASPDSHQLVFENDEVRVLKLSLIPGQKEKMHYHPFKSVMISEVGVRIRYYNEKSEIVFEQYVPGGIYWLEPEGIHCVENVDKIPFYGYRIEIKK